MNEDEENIAIVFRRQKERGEKLKIQEEVLKIHYARIDGKLLLCTWLLMGIYFLMCCIEVFANKLFLSFHQSKAELFVDILKWMSCISAIVFYAVMKHKETIK